MPKNLGAKNEFCFIAAMNQKKFKELDFLLQDMVLYLFPNISNNAVIKCYKNFEYEKGDICIEVNSIKKYVSIKRGIKNSVHGEKLETFVKFLRKKGIDEFTLNELLKYHYADGTIDGSGKVRQSIIEYKINNQESIDNVNKVLNSKEILGSIINRFILQGTQGCFNKIDLLLYGSLDGFFYITPKEIISYIFSKRNIASSSIHFSCLTYQPQHRVLDYDKNKEEYRHCIQIKWYNLEDNIIEIMNRRFLNQKI